MNRTAIAREDVTIDGPAGRLEGLFEYQRGVEPVAKAVICHPHPQYQGTLHNKVAFTLARAAVAAGAEALRFNFRGVGASEGSYDGGRGELADLYAAEDWLARRRPQLPLWRLGFSFGAAIVLRASSDSPCALLVTVAPPVGHFSDYGVPRTPPRAGQWLLIQGDADDIVDPRTVTEWVDALTKRPRVLIFEGAGHFFHGRLQELREKLLPFLHEVRPGTEAA